MIEAIITASFLAPLAILASLWGVLALVVYLFIVSAFFEDDWWFRGVLFLAIPLYIAYGIGVVSIPTWGDLGYGVGKYLIAGIVWSFFRWIIFVYDLKRVIKEFIDMKPEWRSRTPGEKGISLWEFLSETKDYSGYCFGDHLERSSVRGNLNLVPNLSHWRCKARVFSWIVYWPFSIFNYVYSRLLKDLVDFLIERMKGVYNLIAMQIMKGLQV